MATIATVSPTELIRSTWGNSVATELNANCVKVDGSLAMTGTLTINPGNAPALKLRRTSVNAPYLQFETSTGTTVFGIIQGDSAGLNYQAPSDAGAHQFRVNTIERFNVDTTGAQVNGILESTNLTVNAKGTFGGNGELIRLVDTSTSGSDFHDINIGFYGAGASIVSPGTRTGVIGYGGTTTLDIRNFVLNGGVTISGDGTGTVSLASGTGGTISITGTNVNITSGTGSSVFNSAGVQAFQIGGVEAGRISGSTFLWAKTASNTATAGVEILQRGAVYLTTATNAGPNMQLRHNTNADNAAFVQFVNASGGILSEIQQDDVAPVGIKITSCAVTAPSDYRLKDDLGPVTGAVDRVLQLQPKHLAWKETGHEFDGFIAHEVAAVVPDAVTGDKDAVYDADEAERMGVEPGTIKPQGLDQIPLIPLLTAALQELAERVTALEDI